MFLPNVEGDWEEGFLAYEKAKTHFPRSSKEEDQFLEWRRSYRKKLRDSIAVGLQHQIFSSSSFFQNPGAHTHTLLYTLRKQLAMEEVLSQDMKEEECLEPISLPANLRWILLSHLSLDSVNTIQEEMFFSTDAFLKKMYELCYSPLLSLLKRHGAHLENSLSAKKYEILSQWFQALLIPLKIYKETAVQNTQEQEIFGRAIHHILSELCKTKEGKDTDHYAQLKIHENPLWEGIFMGVILGSIILFFARVWYYGVWLAGFNPSHSHLVIHCVRNTFSNNFPLEDRGTPHHVPLGW